ncbi:MAG TPA: protein-disulfide reductase DsbD domain-containing protein [Terriglobia bacterium]|nr:protein-disulfide reductase DsbD domain-containing protein [Terriglobia bacterium]
MKPNHGFRRKGALLLVPLLSLWAAPGKVAGASGPHGAVDLVSEQTSVQPARPFWVGLRFQLEQGWHIYWTNPGDSGEPPRVKWGLPAGFQAGPLHWPVPRRIEDHSLIDYGYQGEVLLPAEISPPAKLAAGADVQLNATVSWLVCREICVPGRAALALTLPTGNGTPGPASPMHPLFAKARADLPRPAPKSWKVSANLDKYRFVLNVDTGIRETGATFFPLEPNQIENAAPQKASPSSRGVRLEMEKSDQLLKAPPRLTGVLVLPAGQGYVIEAPIVASK